MSKAERRRKARARARERQASPSAPDALERAVEAVAAGTEPAPPAAATSKAPESEFITGPVAPRAAARPAPVAQRAPAPVRSVALAAEDEDDEDDEDDDEDDVDGEGEGDEDEEGDDDEDADDDLDAQEDALFNLACAAVEEGEALGWQEAATLLMTAEVLDPRLALVLGLLVEGASEDEDAPKHVPLPLTGARVLKVLTELGLPDLVDEAREVATLAPGEEEDSPDERELVRTNARALNDLAKRELGDSKRGQKAEREPGRPLRASDMKAKRSSLSSGVTTRRPT